MEKIKEKDVISLTKYARVKSVFGTTVRAVDLHDGKDFEIHGKDLQDTCMSADFFYDTEKSSRTKLVEVLIGSWGRPFTAVFDKADKKERTVRGRLLSTNENQFGRSTVEDLDKPDGERIILVDHRTLKSIVVDNVKFTLK